MFSFYNICINGFSAPYNVVKEGIKAYKDIKSHMKTPHIELWYFYVLLHNNDIYIYTDYSMAMRIHTLAQMLYPYHAALHPYYNYSILSTWKMFPSDVFLNIFVSLLRLVFLCYLSSADSCRMGAGVSGDQHNAGQWTVRLKLRGSAWCMPTLCCSPFMRCNAFETQRTQSLPPSLSIEGINSVGRCHYI